VSAEEATITPATEAERLVEIVRRIYAAFSRGDIETLMEHLDDDVIHVVPGSSQVSGRHSGRGTVLALYGRLFELTAGTLHVELERLVTDGAHRVIASHTATMKHHGEMVRQPAAVLFTLRNDKVVEIQDFFTDIALNDLVFN
jgi:ketosteroid isomerase-like protein